jgi:hypothetical protein
LGRNGSLDQTPETLFDHTAEELEKQLKERD